jgi:hypothetical protein
VEYTQDAPAHKRRDTSLSAVIRDAALRSGCSLTALSVLSDDPYRIDTPAGRVIAKWFAENLNRAIVPVRQIHLRGLHYALMSIKGLRKPNGKLYRNTDEDWNWLQSAAKAARFLGYVPFDRIADNRNAEPIRYRVPYATPHTATGVNFSLYADIPDVEGQKPWATTPAFMEQQPYQFAIFGEKASLHDVLDPVARSKGADLWLPTGEPSDTHIYDLAKGAAADGRPLVVFYFSDCDPAGRQMRSPSDGSFRRSATSNFPILKPRSSTPRSIPSRCAS